MLRGTHKVSIRNELLTGLNVKKYLEEIASLRIEIFREYPYLYDGNRNDELNYLQHYAEVSDACAIVAFDDENVVGAATGIPLGREEGLHAPFANSHHPVNETYYVGELLFYPAYRNQGLGVDLLAMMENYVRFLGRYRYLACATVVRPDDHPQRPQEYVQIERFLARTGFVALPGITTSFAWREIDGSSSEHPMQFWVKSLS